MKPALQLVCTFTRPKNIRVLTDEFVQRLAKMNHVSRQLRRQGFRVTDEQDAAITVVLEDQPSRRRQYLLRLGHGCVTTTLHDGSKRCLTSICGINVSWLEAA